MHSSIDRHLKFFYILAIMNNSAMNICIQVFVRTYVFISLVYIHRSRITGSCNFLMNCQTVFQSSYTILLSPSHVWGFQYFYIFANTCYFCLLDYSFASEYKVVFHCGLDLMANDVRHLFVYLSAICVSSLEKCLLKSAHHLKN